MTDVPSDGPADQYACTEAILRSTPEAAIVANLGVASWVLAAVEDRDRNFYMRGAMGATTATGLGLALALDDPVTVLEGDGSLLMSLGCLSTVGEYAPEDFVVVVWDNRSYATTGGQPTNGVDFSAVANDCGLRGFDAVTDGEFEDAYREAVALPGPALVACRVDPADASAPPNYDYGHQYLTHRFRTAVGAE